MRKVDLREQLIVVRTLVGFLGEKSQSNWWASSFFSPSSKAFLEPVFGKTFFLSQYHGVREAAARVHDEHIGVGRGVFHLFRLPEAIERELHSLINDNYISDHILNAVSSVSFAEDEIALYIGKEASQVVGPVRVGGLDDIKKNSTWQVVAGYYYLSFKNNTKVYPYFSEEK
jgi:hypothetical protein